MSEILVVKDPESYVIDETKTLLYDVKNTLSSELPEWSSDDVDVVDSPLALRKTLFDILNMTQEVDTVIVTGLPNRPIWVNIMKALGAIFITSEQTEIVSVFDICETRVEGIHLDSGIVISGFAWHK